MEDLTIESPESELSDDDTNLLPVDADPDTEPVLPESEDDPDEGYYGPEPDENDVEDAESDTDESSESDTAPGEESEDSEQYPEKTDRPVSAPETVSGNSTDYSYDSGSDASTHEAYESGDTVSLLMIETLERQNDILFAGFTATLFILGIILGVLVMHGFRLRRV